MLFIGSRNGEISLWDCDSEDMATISFVKTFTSYENERITCMETYSVNSNDSKYLITKKEFSNQSFGFFFQKNTRLLKKYSFFCKFFNRNESLK